MSRLAMTLYIGGKYDHTVYGGPWRRWCVELVWKPRTMRGFSIYDRKTKKLYKWWPYLKQYAGGKG